EEVRDLILKQRAGLAKNVEKDENSKWEEEDGEEDVDLEQEDDGTLTNPELRVTNRQLRGFLELKHVCKFFLGTFYFQLKGEISRRKKDGENEEMEGAPEASNRTVEDEVQKKEIIQALEKQEAEWYENAKVVRKEVQCWYVRVEQY